MTRIPASDSLVTFQRIRVSKNSNKNWLNDHLQFARLLSEIMANVEMNETLAEIAESMDLTTDEVQDLFDRAQAAWDDVKERT